MKGKKETKSTFMRARVTPKEKELLMKQAAKIGDLSESDFVRYKLGLTVIIPAKLK